MMRGLLTPFRGYLGAAAVGAAAMLACSGTALAGSDWPTGPVTLVPHSKPGGSPDVFVRTLAKSLEKVIGQSIVAANAPGGGGATQMAKIRPAKPDGLTLGVATLTHLSLMLTNLKGTFALDDFSWVAGVQEEAILLFVRSDSKIKNLDDLVSQARKGGTPLSVGGFGPVGSMQNIGLSMLEKAAQVKFNWGAFNSTPDVIAALLGGHVDVGVSSPGATRPFFEADRILGLGVLRKERLPSLPELPTFAEQGYKVDTNWVQVRGFFGPAGIPIETQQKIADAIQEAVKAETYQAYAKNAGIENAAMGPAEYAKFVRHATSIAETQLRAGGVIK